MQVKEVMTASAEVARPGMSIRDVAELMRSRDIGMVPVCDGEKLVGMVSDRDIAIRAVAAGCDPATTSVEDVMTPEVAYILEEQDVEDAATMMEERQVRRLPVLNAEKRLVGIVSMGDLALKTGDSERVGEALEEVAAALPQR